jgi:hypothetical protein
MQREDGALSYSSLRDTKSATSPRPPPSSVSRPPLLRQVWPVPALNSWQNARVRDLNGCRVGGVAPMG